MKDDGIKAQTERTPYEQLAEAIMRQAEVDRCLMKTHLVELIELHAARWQKPIVRDEIVLDDEYNFADPVQGKIEPPKAWIRKRDYSDGIKEGPKEFTKSLQQANEVKAWLNDAEREIYIERDRRREVENKAYIAEAKRILSERDQTAHAKCKRSYTNKLPGRKI